MLRVRVADRPRRAATCTSVDHHAYDITALSPNAYRLACWKHKRVMWRDERRGIDANLDGVLEIMTQYGPEWCRRYINTFALNRTDFAEIERQFDRGLLTLEEFTSYQINNEYMTYAAIVIERAENTRAEAANATA